MMKLEIVTLIARYQKITAVAEKLSLKQPTITFHMKSLETELGVPLFEARGGKIRLTEAGQALNHYAEKITSLTEEARRTVAEFSQTNRGTLRIGASYVPATYLLPERIHSFSETHKGVSFSLTVQPAPFIRGMLSRHDIDLAIISSQPFAEPELICRQLAEDQMHVVYSTTHPLAGKEVLSFEDLVQEEFIMHGTDSTTRYMTEEWRRDHKLQLHTQIEISSLEAIKQALMTGKHMSIMSRLAMLKEQEAGLLTSRPLPGKSVARYMYLTYNKDRWLSPLISSFIDHILLLKS